MLPNAAFLSAALVASLIVCAAGLRAQAPFDYFVFVRQWPGTVCNVKARHACTVPPKNNIFTLHGLWPQYSRGGWPEECTDDQFNPRKVDGLRDRLSYEWPSYYGSNDGFWAHEWEKHGTCASPVVNDEAEYFALALKLNERFNLTAAVQSADITPGSGEEVRTAAVARAIKSYTGGDPTIHCLGGNVYEVWLCLDKQLQPFDCPGSLAKQPARSSNSYCGQFVALPAITTRSQQSV